MEPPGSGHTLQSLEKRTHPQTSRQYERSLDEMRAQLDGLRGRLRLDKTPLVALVRHPGEGGQFPARRCTSRAIAQQVDRETRSRRG